MDNRPARAALLAPAAAHVAGNQPSLAMSNEDRVGDSRSGKDLLQLRGLRAESLGR